MTGQPNDSPNAQTSGRTFDYMTTRAPERINERFQAQLHKHMSERPTAKTPGRKTNRMTTQTSEGHE